MPIGPANAIQLLDVYDDLVSGATDLVGAASAIAPAAVRDVLCKAGGLAGLLGGPLGGLQGPGGPYGTPYALGGILQAACPVPPPVPGPPPTEAPPPFTGGQCECVFYRVSYRFKTANPASDVTGQFLRRGPITGPINGGSIPENPNRASWGFYYGAAQCGGKFFELLAGAPSGTPAGDFTLTITGVERVDGAADNCGSQPSPGPAPPPEIPQPPPSGPIPTVGPDGNPGPDFIFEPTVGPIFFGPSGEVNVPVTVNISGSVGGPVFNIPVSVGLPDFNPTFVNPGPSGGDPGVPPTPPATRCCEPPPPVENPYPPQPEGEEPDLPPTGRKIIGVTVTSSVSGRSRATEYYAAEPEIYVPRIATLQFRIKAGLALRWALPVEIKSKSQFVPAPTRGEVVEVSVKWEGGWTGSYRTVIGTA